MTEKLVRENERVDDLQNGYYVRIRRNSALGWMRFFFPALRR